MINEGTMQILYFLLMFILVYMVSGVIHELGHVVTGLMNGWKFILLIVGPFGLKRDENDNIVFYFEKRIILWGGAGGTIPYNDNPRNLKVWKQVLLAGPLASLIMGCIFLPLGIIYNNMIFLLLGAMPLGMGVMCILPLPIKTGILYSDGYRYKRLMGKGQPYLEEKALFELVQKTALTEDYGSIDYSEVEALINSEDKSMKYYGYFYSKKYYLAINEIEHAEKSEQEMTKLEQHVSKIIVDDCK